MQARTPWRAAMMTLAAAAGFGLAACGGGEGYPAQRAQQLEQMAEPTSAYPAPGDAADSDAADSGPAESDMADSGSMTGDSVAGLGGASLLIGTDATYPPMESTDESGNIVGFDPALMQAICVIADCRPTFKATAWDGIFAALAAGEFDALMSSITILPEREESGKAKFTVPYYSVGQVIVVRADNTTLTGVEGLTTAIVGVQKATTGDTAATEKGGVPEANMRRFPNNVLAMQALKNGDVDAVVCDDPTAQRYIGDDPTAFKLAGEPFTREDYGILVPADRTDLLAAFNAAILTLQSDGTIDALLAEYAVGMPADDAPDAAGADAATSDGASAGDAVTATTGATVP